jgi:homoserine O-succinyltransferase
MAIVLPPGHPSASLATSDGGARRVRIGIINIMPRLEAYEPLLLAPLARTEVLVEPVFVRLGTHTYQSSDQAHLAAYYRSFEGALDDGPLDGLVLTGAPVEELPFEEVRYFDELTEILRYARAHVTATLGLCWGGLLLGRLAGIGKHVFPRKLFGVFEDQVLVPGHELVGGARSFVCAHSRHSGFVPEELERAARDGVVRLLSRGEETGASLLETADGRYIAHTGHPEYVGERLAFEWQRDRDLGRTDVLPPANFDADAPATTWRAHQDALFAGFVGRVARTSTRRPSRSVSDDAGITAVGTP